MDVLTENFSLYGKGFLGTVELTVYASALALVLGFLMASCRVAPVGSLLVLGTVWVTVLRNTPLTLLFFAVLLGLPASASSCRSSSSPSSRSAATPRLGHHQQWWR
ncbi:hypothetical protein SBADM41S_11692 [Streptomyces badius]